jgi:outer membrane receptor for ferric coprogen and ferric-rhodotorulic acid
MNYQSNVSYLSSTTAYQGGYSVLNLMASYDINKNLNLAFNLYNALNKKYLNSVSQGSGYYAAPINGSVAIIWKY